MATPFEAFVNAELPKRISTEHDQLNVSPGLIPVTTGVGLSTVLQELSTVLPEEYIKQIIGSVLQEYTDIIRPTNVVYDGCSSVFDGYLPVIDDNICGS